MFKNIKKSFSDFIEEINEEVEKELREKKQNNDKTPAKKENTTFAGFLEEVFDKASKDIKSHEKELKDKKTTSPKYSKENFKDQKTQSPLGNNGDFESFKRLRTNEEKNKTQKIKSTGKKNKLRSAIVMAEILGKPVSKRR